MLDVTINRKMLPMKGHYFFWNAATAPVVPFLSTYAKQLGFSSATVGVMYMVMPIMGMIAKPVFGAIADRFRCQKIIFLTFILVTAAAFLATFYSPQLPVERKMHFACDRTEAVFDTCVNNNSTDKCAAEYLQQELGHNGTIHCEASCPMRPEFWNTVCNEWGVTQYCDVSKRGDNLEFRVELPLAHAIEMGQCMYFKVENAIFSDNSEHYPNCMSENSSMYSTCDVTCDVYSVNDMIVSPTVTDNEVYNHYEFWLVFVFMIFGWVGQAIVVSVTDAVCFEMLDNKPNKYGIQRSFGALGWGIMSIVAGFIIDSSSSGTTKNYIYAFYLAFALLLVDFLVSYKLDYTQKKMSASILRDVGKLLVNIRVLIFLIFNIFIGMCTGLIWQFLFWLVEDLGKEQGCDFMEWIKTLEGLIMGIQCLLGELPFFFLSGWILKRIGYVHAMSLILLTIGVRYILYSVIANPWYFLPVELLNGVTYGLFYASMASYASIIAPPGTETTVQGLVGAVFEGVGVSLGSLVGGSMFNAYGGVWTFRMFGIASLVFCLLHAAVQFWIQRSQPVSDVRYAAPQDAINILTTQSKY